MWQRTNHAGRQVTLLEGPVWVAGAMTGMLAAWLFAVPEPSSPAVSDGASLDLQGSQPGGAAEDPSSSRSAALANAATVVTLAAGALGALDDLVGSSASKGLRGHLRALGKGKVTTGAIKIGGLAMTGLLGAAIADGRRRTLAGTMVGGAVVAGAANAVNLFDLRPGRALKVVTLVALPLALKGSAPAAAALGSSAGVLPDDLAGTSMLGDTGANAAGALVGLALLERTGLRGRLAALAVLTGLTLASERVSFTKVIKGHDVLRRFDEWGRSRS
jgi:UDP-N-acetylmuramyl pentapeptide phosphotransferase/UDP-N-acetylglucosamine-1-phosphate transferase